MRTPDDIIKLAKSFKEQWHTNNPYIIADKLGIAVVEKTSNIKDFTAQVIKMEGYPTIISINDIYSDFSRKVLCAHELGHALLHENCFNAFATTSSNVLTDVEYEANLFALALLADNNINEQLNIPLERMNNYILKVIMDYNIKKK